MIGELSKSQPLVVLSLDLQVVCGSQAGHHHLGGPHR